MCVLMDFERTHLRDHEDQRLVGAFPLDIHHFHIPPLLLPQAEIPVPNFAAVGHSLRPPYCYYQMCDRRNRAWQLPIADLVHHHRMTLVAAAVVVEHTWPWLLGDLVLGEQATAVAGEVLVLDEADGHMGRRLHRAYQGTDQIHPLKGIHHRRQLLPQHSESTCLLRHPYRHLQAEPAFEHAVPLPIDFWHAAWQVLQTAKFLTQLQPWQPSSLLLQPDYSPTWPSSW
mmetsp:Transcript_539/g.984  ORF Transcript_539/g.984 Transcript_539/m.984 type:complete len:228 (+) Transcript_539:124-807(+)